MMDVRTNIEAERASTGSQSMAIFKTFHARKQELVAMLNDRDEIYNKRVHGQGYGAWLADTRVTRIDDILMHTGSA